MMLAFDPRQLLLFGLTMAQPAANENEIAAAVEAESGEKLSTRRIKPDKHGRQQLPSHLPRVEIVHDLKDVEKPCPCCGETRACIGSETSDQLEIIPATLQVLKHVRQKYASRSAAKAATTATASRISRSRSNRRSRLKKVYPARDC